MDFEIRELQPEDAPQATAVWNQVVACGAAFPQVEPMTDAEGLSFFRAQSCTGIAASRDTGEVLGLYTLHPNNVGRCGHIANASFAVRESARGDTAPGRRW